MSVQNHIVLWSGVFFGMVILDFIWVGYVVSLQKTQAVSAGLWAAIMIIVTGFVTVSYVNDPWLLIPAALGAFVGACGGSKILQVQH
jgi:hypothetical protein